MKRLLALISAFTICLSLTACSDMAPNLPDETSLAVCFAAEPSTLDPALITSTTDASMVSHLFSGLAKWSQDENGNAIIEADAAEFLSEGVPNPDGTVTYVYTLRSDMQWSDGQAVTAADFEFAWKRSASTRLATNYGYLFDVISGYPDSLSVIAKDEKTLEVTLNSAVPYWNELLAFPAFFPIRKDVISKEDWSTDPDTCISNGAYTLKSWTSGSIITLEKNPTYVGAHSIKLDKLECYISGNSSDSLSGFERGSWLFIDDIPARKIAELKTAYPKQFVTIGQCGTCFLTWDVNQPLLPADSRLTGEAAAIAESEIRSAINLLFDRNYIVDQVTQTGQMPASTLIPIGMTSFDGTPFHKTNTPQNYIGYYNTSPEAYHDNWGCAIDTLKKYYTWDGEQFTNFPTLTYLHNTSDLHTAIGKYLSEALASIGITLNTEDRPWGSFLSARQKGSFSLTRDGLQSSINDPIFFLDLWCTDSIHNHAQFGNNDHEKLQLFNLDLTSHGYNIQIENGTWAETYDVLLSTIKSCTDHETRYELMHLAEDMLMSTGCIMPLYYYTDIYMISERVNGFFTNPLGCKYFMCCTVDPG